MNINRFRKWVNIRSKASEEEVEKLINIISNLEESNEEFFNQSIEAQLSSQLDQETVDSIEKSAIDLYKSYLKDERIINKVKEAKDIFSSKHDGSYKLVQETIRAIGRTDKSVLDLDDLDLLYSMVIGSWKASKNIRMQRVEKSNLPSNEKERLKNVIEKVFNNAKEGEYINSNDGSVGMFGTGFLSFSKNSTKEDATEFLMICTEILKTENIIDAFDIVEKRFGTNIKGIGVATASETLHCLKPNWFMIINGAIIKKLEVFELEGLNFKTLSSVANYIHNNKEMLEFRDKSCNFSNFRVLDYNLFDMNSSIEIDLSFLDSVDKNGDILTIENKDEKEISVLDWKGLLQNRDVFYKENINMMVNIFDLGGAATMKQLGEKTNVHPSSFISPVVSLAKRVQQHTQCSIPKNEENSKWWPILFDGRYTKSNHFEWRLKDNLYEAVKDLYEVLTRGTTYSKYTKEEFLADIFVKDDEYDELVNLLEYKKNLILQGPPGVGKTYIAKRLAYSIMGVRDESRVEMIQFHQSYSYEDFIMGYRPNENGFSLKEGPFYQFCKKAEKDSGNNYYFIIDEINRGNLSKIFGELMMLIEDDKRGQELKLAYKDEYFSVPENVFLIGTMNTADRSLAIIDYALRRRFSFYTLSPAFDNDKFKQYLYEEGLDEQLINTIVARMLNLNNNIVEERGLGEGFQIGHSYFCKVNANNSKEWFKSIIKYEIKPLLKEYFFDNLEKADNLSKDLLGK